MKILLWILVACVLVLRLVAACTLPLTGDEAYYWEWSLRPAFGYIDHPPAVAWIIASCAWLGRSAGTIRLGFWLCGCVATLACADAARRYARSLHLDARAAAAFAAFIISVAPIATVALTTASPDGPYLAAWALALDFALMAMEQPRGQWYVLIEVGIAVGAAVMSRVFAWAFLFGTMLGLRRVPRAMPAVCMTALFIALPYFLWNEQHDWANIRFSLFGRHVNEGFSLFRPLVTIVELLAAFGPGTCIMVFAALRSAPIAAEPASAMRNFLLWTAVPLPIFFLLESLNERVETYWFLGPYLSLSVLAAAQLNLSFARMRVQWAAIFAPSLLLTALLLSIAMMPLLIWKHLALQCHLRLKYSGPFEIYTYNRLAYDVRRLADRDHAVVMTDGYGLSALLDHAAGLPPVVIGYDQQGREARKWFADDAPVSRALFVDKQALSERGDIAHRLALACRRVVPGPTLSYTLPYLPNRVYSTTWCDEMVPHGIGILRWQNTRQEGAL